MHEAQTNSDQQAGETSKRRNQALATDNGERIAMETDRDRATGSSVTSTRAITMRPRGGTVGVPGVVVGDGGFDCGDGIRVAQRRGFKGSIRSIAPAIFVATRVGAAVSLGGPGSTPKRGRSSRFALPVRIA
jgi:hypothetical protein